MIPIPGADYLKSVFEYVDGALFWKQRPADHFGSAKAWAMWNARFANKRAGREMVRAGGDTGYRQVMIDGCRLLEHRVIAAMFGLNTADEIDHIDGDPSNNRIENLRPAKRHENCRNNAGWGKKFLRVGVHAKKNGRFTAYIRSNDGKQTHLGTFVSEQEAVAARKAAETLIYGGFARAASSCWGRARQR
jgi:hypothetical protein